MPQWQRQSVSKVPRAVSAAAAAATPWSKFEHSRYSRETHFPTTRGSASVWDRNVSLFRVFARTRARIRRSLSWGSSNQHNQNNLQAEEWLVGGGGGVAVAVYLRVHWEPTFSRWCFTLEQIADFTSHNTFVWRSVV